MGKCKTCGKEFPGTESWKTQCYDCYREFKGMSRISVLTPHKGVFILAHPDVTEEEVNEFIKKKFGSVKDPAN